MQRSRPADPLDESHLLIAEFVAQADVASATRHKYRIHLSELLAWLNHPRTQGQESHAVQLSQATAADLHRYMAYLRGDERYAAADHHLVRAGLSASARKNVLGSIRSFYRYLRAVEVIASDPSLSIKTPRIKRRPGLTISPEEVRLILDAPGSARSRIQAHLLTYTAARTEEIQRLRWRDVDFVRATVTLHGKGGKVRVLDIHPRLMSELRRWYIHQDDEAQRYPAMRIAKLQPETDYVLLTRHGKQVPKNLIARQLKDRAARAGVHQNTSPTRDNKSAVSPHVLRRTFATVMLERGHHLDAIADVFGHDSTDTTRNHYAFASNARRRDTIHGYDV